MYGSIAAGSWTESDSLFPDSSYSAAKAGADFLCRAHHRTDGLDVRVTRCSNNYGHSQYPEKVIPLFVTNLIDGYHVPFEENRSITAGVLRFESPWPRWRL